ncbi:MAG: hypothetical protein AAF569_08795 [Pseudomonadota bacterium]
MSFISSKAAAIDLSKLVPNLRKFWPSAISEPKTSQPSVDELFRHDMWDRGRNDIFADAVIARVNKDFPSLTGNDREIALKHVARTHENYGIPAKGHPLVVKMGKVNEKPKLAA